MTKVISKKIISKLIGNEFEYPLKKVTGYLPKEYGRWLDAFDWNYFCTFTTRYPLSPKSARRLINKFGDYLLEQDPARMLFWAIEPFELRDGCHYHLLLKTTVSSRKAWSWWFYNYGRNDLKNYDRDKKGSEYMAKYVTKQLSDFDMIS